MVGIGIHHEGRASHLDGNGNAVAVHEIEFDRRAEPPGPRISANPIWTPPAMNIASGDPTIVSLEHANSFASPRLAYTMSPLDERVAAPSRMFSTNMRYDRSAVDSVYTRGPGLPSETTNASTSPALIARSVSSASVIRARASDRVVAASSAPSAAPAMSTSVVSTASVLRVLGSS